MDRSAVYRRRDEVNRGALLIRRSQIENKAVRLPFRVQCRACGWSTDAGKLEAVAVKLWNEAKREDKARARRK